MDIVQIFSLAVLQGLTEFLPISSSAHLILMPKLLHWPDQGITFDVAVHVGTLAAVLFYFRHELKKLLVDCITAFHERQTNASLHLTVCIIIGTVPATLIGLCLSDAIATHLRAPVIIACANIGFGLMLWWSDTLPHAKQDEYAISYRQAILIGAAQALAFIPGASRSGTTIMAGLLLGLSRQAAARFSFLLSIPIIIGAGSLLTMQLTKQVIDWPALILGATVSAIVAYLCIHYFLKLLDRIGMLPFVLYRLLLGIVLLLLFA